MEGMFPWYVYAARSIGRSLRILGGLILIPFMLLFAFIVDLFNPRGTLFWIVWVPVALFISYHFISKYW